MFGTFYVLISGLMIRFKKLHSGPETDILSQPLA
jgi:hypothetical protein